MSEQNFTTVQLVESAEKVLKASAALRFVEEHYREAKRDYCEAEENFLILGERFKVDGGVVAEHPSATTPHEKYFVEAESDWSAINKGNRLRITKVAAAPK